MHMGHDVMTQLGFIDGYSIQVDVVDLVTRLGNRGIWNRETQGLFALHQYTPKLTPATCASARGK
jgi:hypothetical protein